MVVIKANRALTIPARVVSPQNPSVSRLLTVGPHGSKATNLLRFPTGESGAMFLLAGFHEHPLVNASDFRRPLEGIQEGQASATTIEVKPLCNAGEIQFFMAGDGSLAEQILPNLLTHYRRRRLELHPKLNPALKGRVEAISVVGGEDQDSIEGIQLPKPRVHEVDLISAGGALSTAAVHQHGIGFFKDKNRRSSPGAGHEAVQPLLAFNDE